MDAGLIWKEMGADLALADLDLVKDNGLQTAVVLSLFCDRRAREDDPLPDNSGDLRGWWADAYAPVLGDNFGSRLWLLGREKQLPKVLERAREYAEEALAWLVEDGVAQSVKVTAWVVRQGVLGLLVEIARPDASRVEYQFNRLWEAM